VLNQVFSILEEKIHLQLPPNSTLNLIDLISFEFNLTDIGVSNLALDYTACGGCNLMTLLDNWGVL